LLDFACAVTSTILHLHSSAQGTVAQAPSPVRDILRQHRFPCLNVLRSYRLSEHLFQRLILNPRALHTYPHNFQRAGEESALSYHTDGEHGVEQAFMPAVKLPENSPASAAEVNLKNHRPSQNRF